MGRVDSVDWWKSEKGCPQRPGRGADSLTSGRQSNVGRKIPPEDVSGKMPPKGSGMAGFRGEKSGSGKKQPAPRRTGRSAIRRPPQLAKVVTQLTGCPVSNRIKPVRVSCRMRLYAVRAGVAEWQTRWIQNPVSFGTCGFKSHLRYFFERKDLRQFATSPFCVRRFWFV